MNVNETVFVAGSISSFIFTKDSIQEKKNLDSFVENNLRLISSKLENSANLSIILSSQIY